MCILVLALEEIVLLQVAVHVMFLRYKDILVLFETATYRTYLFLPQIIWHGGVD